MKNVVSMERAADLLLEGKVGVIPTDTVYGVVAKAASHEAVTKLYELKERDGKPGTVIAANIEQLVELGIPRRYMTAMASYWPNPISIILPYGNLNYLHLGKGAVATRIPKDQSLRAVLEKTGPLLTSSANKPSEPTSTTIKEAQTYFGDSIDFYVDGGDLSDRLPSTIMRVVDDAVEVLREGAIKIGENGETIE